MSMGSKFYLGLDIGTASCGWACTDENYKVLRMKGRDAWGVRIFEEAQTAEERRKFRCARRRLDRRRYRIHLLNEIFAASPELQKIDPDFLLRLEQSSLLVEDRTVGKGEPSLLFQDRDKERNFYKNFPTMFSLRKAMLIGPDGDIDPYGDIRYVYLAVHHIIKYRGNFLREGQEITTGQETDDLVAKILEANDYAESLVSDDGEKDAHFLVGGEEGAKNFLQFIKDAKSSGAYKELKNASFAPSWKEGRTILETIFRLALCSKDVAAGNFMPFSRDDSETKFTLNDSKFEDKTRPELEGLLNDSIIFVDLAKALYDWKYTLTLLGGDRYLSVAMDRAMRVHRDHLNLLKRFLSLHEKYLPENCHFPNGDYYRKMFFVVKGANNYAAYIGHGIPFGSGTNDRSEVSVPKCTRNDFYVYVQSLVKDCLSDIDFSRRMAAQIAEEQGMDLEDAQNLWRSEGEAILELVQDSLASNFMPIQARLCSSSIPYQLHYNELVEILGKASERYPFLLVEDESGISAKDKILMLMKFRVPYYVGPLVDQEGHPHSWAVKREGKACEIVTPWNFDSVIDRDASRKKFIGRMVGECTYIKGRKSLPASSLAYQDYLVLSEINNIKVRGKRIESDLKDIIYNLALIHKTISVKGVLNALQSKGIIEGLQERDIALPNGKNVLQFSLSSFINFKEKVFKCSEFVLKGSPHFKREYEEFAEYAIFVGTLFTDEESRRRQLAEKYPGQKWAEYISRAVRFSYKQWGRLSNDLLNGVLGSINGLTVLDTMRERAVNLMELLNDNERYGFQDPIRQLNHAYEDGLRSSSLREHIEAISSSPAVRKGIYQSIRIVQEIRKAAGRDPDKIFVEVTRGGGKKGVETNSRYKQLKELICKKEIQHIPSVAYEELIENLESANGSGSLKSEDVYLYFLQLGKDMYTGETIPFDSLGGGAAGAYNADHIVPRSKRRDDSLGNKVLVRQIVNSEKTDIYPVSLEIQHRMKPFWSRLYSLGLMGKEKYGALTRTTDLTPEERVVFVKSQLVATSQIVKGVITLLKEMMPNTRVVYSKARNVSDFRSKFHIVKIREINDMHHAHDAYLNVVVGNVLDTRYRTDTPQFLELMQSRIDGDMSKPSADLIKSFEVAVPGAWLPSVEKQANHGTIGSVKEQLCCFSPIVTIESNPSTGKFYDANLSSVAKGGEDCDVLSPLTENANDPRSDVSRYGGYNNRTTAFYVVADDPKSTLIQIPVLYSDKERIRQYLNSNGLRVKPGIPRFAINQKIANGKNVALIGGITGDRVRLKNGIQLSLDQALLQYVKDIFSYISKLGKGLAKKLTDVEDYLPAQQRQPIPFAISGKGVVSRCFTCELNVDLFNALVEKMDPSNPKSPYSSSKGFKNTFKVLSSKMAAFQELPVLHQLVVLRNILLFYSRGSQTIDLRLLGEGKSVGACNIKVSGFSGWTLIFESPAGFYRREVKL